MDAHEQTTIELKKCLTKAHDARYRTKISAEFHLLAKSLGVQEATTSRLCMLEIANWHILQFQELLRKKSNTGRKSEGCLDEVKGKFSGIILKDPFFFKKGLVPEDVGSIVSIKKVIAKNKHSSVELRTQETPVLPAITTRSRKKRTKHKAKNPSQKKKESKTRTGSNKKTACKKTKLNAQITTQEKMETRRTKTKIEKEIGALTKRKKPKKQGKRKLNKRRRPETKHAQSNTQNMELPNNEEYIPLLSDNKSVPLLDKKGMDVNPTCSSNLYSLFIADCLEDTSDDDDEMLDEEYGETFKQGNDFPEQSSEYLKGEFSGLLEKNEIDICCLDSSFADKYSDLMNVKTSDLACTEENITAFTGKYSDLMNVQTSDPVCAAENISASSTTKPHLPFDIEAMEINSSDIDFLNELELHHSPI